MYIFFHQFSLYSCFYAFILPIPCGGDGWLFTRRAEISHILRATDCSTLGYKYILYTSNWFKGLYKTKTKHTILEGQGKGKGNNKIKHQQQNSGALDNLNYNRCIKIQYHDTFSVAFIDYTMDKIIMLILKKKIQKNP